MANSDDAVTGEHQVGIHHVRQSPYNDMADFRAEYAPAFPVKKADCCTVDAFESAAISAKPVDDYWWNRPLL